jgi:hypothetical protein
MPCDGKFQGSRLTLMSADEFRSVRDLIEAKVKNLLAGL